MSNETQQSFATKLDQKCIFDFIYDESGQQYCRTDFNSQSFNTNSNQTKTGQNLSHPYFKDNSLNTNGQSIQNWSTLSNRFQTNDQSINTNTNTSDLLSNTTMAATTRPEVFNGNKPIKQWLQQFESYLTANQITTDQDKVCELVPFVTDTALFFFADKIASKFPAITWTETKDLLIRRFDIPDIAPIQLNGCQQRNIGQKLNPCQQRTNSVVAMSQDSPVVNYRRKTEPVLSHRNQSPKSPDENVFSSADTPTTDSTQQLSGDLLIDLSQDCSQQRNTGQQHNTSQPKTNSVVAKSQLSSVVDNQRETEPVLSFGNQSPKHLDENVFSSAVPTKTASTQIPSEDLMIDLSDDCPQPKPTAMPFQTNEVLIPINISTAPQKTSLLDADIDEKQGHSKSLECFQRSIETIQSDGNRKSNQPEEQPQVLNTTSKSDFRRALTRIKSTATQEQSPVPTTTSKRYFRTALTQINSTQTQEQPTVFIITSKSKSRKPRQQHSHRTALVLKPKEKTLVKQRIPVQRPPLKRRFNFARIRCKSSLNRNKQFNDCPLKPINQKPLDVHNHTAINKWHRKHRSDSQRKRNCFSTPGKHSLRDFNRKATVWFVTEPNLQRWGCEGGATRVSDKMYF